ncbi:alpha/beta hydrolase [Sphingomonas sanxanigenens]|uniref:Hydrolase n=1 Tax=Sphingomonas sanxanigenens DSM 19645 = NX02 TaxID=1123269 RepID=W0AF01_9SPHN|nr:alpha/beta fold hydrolase [Sphingomonas sanxanigenens]AHE55102.1 hydrolase [Sphingomonas sanxanigenens DSM 19645 = NX02]
MAEWTHHRAVINGIAMHWVEQGRGPAIVLAHGFPHIWLSWRHQIAALAAAGWRVIAPDLRGMGQTEAPADHRLYDVPHITGDLVGLLDHLGIDQAVFAGLDFGVFAIYDLAYLHPERVRAVIGLENPFYPDTPDKAPLAEAAEWAKGHFVHIDYFRPVGPADDALDAAPRAFLQKVLYALSGDYHYLDVWKHPPGTPYIDALPEAPPLPWPWLEEWEFEWALSDYSRSGFTGGLNWYRAMDLRWEQRAAWRHRPSGRPFFFIGSENDVDLEAWHGEDPIGAIPCHYSDVRRVEMLPRAGHLIQLERAADVSRLMVEFVAEL